MYISVFNKSGTQQNFNIQQKFNFVLFQIQLQFGTGKVFLVDSRPLHQVDVLHLDILDDDYTDIGEYQILSERILGSWQSVTKSTIVVMQKLFGCFCRMPDIHVHNEYQNVHYITLHYGNCKVVGYDQR